MFTPLRALFLCAFLIIAINTFGQINIVNFDFAAVPPACSGGYSYEAPGTNCSSDLNYNAPAQNFNGAPGFGWILGWPDTIFGDIPYQRGVGVTGPDTAFNPPPFDGLPFNQALFLQNVGAFAWQNIPGFTAGTYTLKFYLGSRYRNDCCDGNQTVQVLVDGHVIGIWAMTSYTPFTLQSATFTVTSGGGHTLQFEGMNLGDHTAFLSYVTITPAGGRSGTY